MDKSVPRPFPEHLQRVCQDPTVMKAARLHFLNRLTKFKRQDLMLDFWTEVESRHGDVWVDSGGKEKPISSLVQGMSFGDGMKLICSSKDYVLEDLERIFHSVVQKYWAVNWTTNCDPMSMLCDLKYCLTGWHRLWLIAQLVRMTLVLKSDPSRILELVCESETACLNSGQSDGPTDVRHDQDTIMCMRRMGNPTHTNLIGAMEQAIFTCRMITIRDEKVDFAKVLRGIFSPHAPMPF